MIKRPQELALLAAAGKLLARVFEHIDQMSLIGCSTMQVNDAVERFIVDQLRARPASKGQYDYPHALNASVNHVVCHGMPSADCVLTSGDIVNFDITLEKDGYIADSSKTYLVGEVTPAARRLVNTCQQALWKGIAAVRPGARLGDVGHAIEQHARRHGYAVVREYCGHGIGQQMHEEPQVLHFGTPGTGVLLREGMVFTIEPMLNQGGAAVWTLDDGWTVVTRDGRLSAQFEHTVAVTRDGVQVLTQRAGERAALRQQAVMAAH